MGIDVVIKFFTKMEFRTVNEEVKNFYKTYENKETLTKETIFKCTMCLSLCKILYILNCTLEYQCVGSHMVCVI